MKELRMSILILISIFSLSLSSCDFNQKEQQPPQIDLDMSNLDLSGLQWDFTRVIDLNEYSFEYISNQLATEIYEIDYAEMAERMELDDNMEPYAEIGILINEKEQTATIIATEQYREKSGPNQRILSDDSKCLGEEGEGWTIYASNCLGPDCVAAAMLAGAEDMGDPGVGECMDFRVVTTLFGARVCGSKYDC